MGALTGLARSFAAQGKISAALVVGDQAIASGDATAELLVLVARLVKDSDVERARRLYLRARERDPGLREPELDDLAAPSTANDQLRLRNGDAPIEGGRWQGAVERPRTTFAQVGGMDSVKEDIRMRIILPLEKPDMFAAYGQKAGGGVLLYGPPGCGKTHLARATAGEVKAGFLSVGINDVLDSYIGQSEKNIHDLFSTARSQQPCVLFFDEVDAIAASRRDLRHSAGRQTINQFLAELDGIEQGANDGLLVLAATNAPWHLDSAFLRPGRFDRIIFVPPPDAAARAAILRILLAGKPTSDIDHSQVAKRTDGFSGADLTAVVERAVQEKLKEALRGGQQVPILTANLLDAAKIVKPSTKDWFATARNHAVYANEGGIYDDVLTYLGIRK
jgi:SpoVK/Ycf46/Vps4 family AAA+-type ATPase